MNLIGCARPAIAAAYPFHLSFFISLENELYTEKGQRP